MTTITPEEREEWRENCAASHRVHRRDAMEWHVELGARAAMFVPRLLDALEAAEAEVKRANEFIRREWEIAAQARDTLKARAEQAERALKIWKDQDDNAKLIVVLQAAGEDMAKQVDQYRARAKQAEAERDILIKYLMGTGYPDVCPEYETGKCPTEYECEDCDVDPEKVKICWLAWARESANKQ